MKNLKKILLVLMILPCTVTAQSNWQGQNNPSGEVPEAIHFTSATHGWISMGDEHIIMTTDGGKNWTLKSMNDVETNGKGFNSTGGYPDIYFFSDKKGWVIGASSEGTSERFTYGGLAYSTNGGQSWEVKWHSDHLYPKGFFWLDEDHGWAVGDSGLTIHTTDGGNSWSTVMVNSDYELKDVYFKDTDNGWAVGGEENFGATQDGFLLRTTDGGDSWSLQETLSPSSSSGNMMINSIYFSDNNNGWADGLRTTDGGNTWTENNAFFGESIYFLDSDFGWYVGFNSVKITTDGGSTWNEAVNSDSLSGQVNLDLAFFINPQTGWITGNEGFDGKIFHKGGGGGTSSLKAAKSSFEIFPNPADKMLHITLKGSGADYYILLSLTGEEVLSGNFHNSGRETLNVQHLNPGIYFLEISNTRSVVTKKIIIQ